MRLALRYLGYALPVRAIWVEGELLIDDPFLELPVAARRLCLGERWEWRHDEFTRLVLPLVELLAIPISWGLVEVGGCGELVATLAQGEGNSSPWAELPPLEQRAVATQIGSVVDEFQGAKPTGKLMYVLQRLPSHKILLPYWRGVSDAPYPFSRRLREIAALNAANWQTGAPTERYFGYPGYNETPEELILYGADPYKIMYNSVIDAFDRNYPEEYLMPSLEPVTEDQYFDIVRTQLHPRYIPEPWDWSHVFRQVMKPDLPAMVAIHFISFTYRPAPWLLQQDAMGKTSRYSLHAQPMVELPDHVVERIVAYASGEMGDPEHCAPIAEQCLANLAQAGMAREVYVDWLLGRALGSTDGPAGPVIAVALAACYLYGYRQTEIYAYLQHHLSQEWRFSARELFVQVGYWLEDDKYLVLWELALKVYPELHRVTYFGLAERRGRLFRVGEVDLPWCL